MAKPDVLVQYLRRAATARPLASLTDAGLLDHFAAGGPTAGDAFELIVRRHGPTVLWVCRVALGEAQADDAFQATFLVLIRRIGAARRARCLDAWLFGTARRVCATARRATGRRVRHETRAGVRPDATVGGRRLEPDVVAAVHAEVGRLDAGERAAVVLCDLTGLTYDEAAARLGVTAAAVRNRLARGRDRLRRRLKMRGVGPEAVWVVPVAVSTALVAATARAAMVFAGRAAGAVPAPVAEFVAGGLGSMIWTKCKAAGLSALTAGVLFAGAVGLSARQQPGLVPAPGTPAPATSAEADFTPPGGTPPGARFKVTADPQDPGDAVAALVRRAQRQQDRGDTTAALTTLAEVDAATKAWKQLLADQADRDASLDQKKQRDRYLADKKRLAGSRLDIAGRTNGTADVQDRLAAVEAKLDRLLQGLDGSDKVKTPPPGRNRTTPPGSSAAPKGGLRPADSPPATDELDGEPRPGAPKNAGPNPFGPKKN